MQIFIGYFPLELDNKNEIVVEIKTRSANGKSVQTLSVGKFEKDCEESLKRLEDLILLLNEMKKKYPVGPNKNESYSSIKGFDKWFSGSSIYGGVLRWPKDLFKEDVDSCLNGFNVYYYDENGRKYETILKL